MLAVALQAVVATPAGAHLFGGDADDPVQEYGVMLFLVAVILIGAGVLVYVMLTPSNGEDVEESRET